jgi:hypothetical protein
MWKQEGHEFKVRLGTAQSSKKFYKKIEKKIYEKKYFKSYNETVQGHSCLRPALLKGATNWIWIPGIHLSLGLWPRDFLFL